MRIHTTPRPLVEMPIGAFAMLPLFGLPLGAWLVETGTIELGTCGFKKAFGLPCLSCGSTRATLHLFHGRFFDAIAMQPMTMAVYALLLVWGSMSLWALVRRRTLHVDLNRAEDIGAKLCVLVIPLLNWGYLVMAGV